MLNLSRCITHRSFYAICNVEFVVVHKTYGGAVCHLECPKYCHFQNIAVSFRAHFAIWNIEFVAVHKIYVKKFYLAFAMLNVL